MLRFVLRKMLNKKWMVLSLLIGNVLMIAISCCNPMYTQAVLQRMLTRSLSDSISEDNRYPTVASINVSMEKYTDRIVNQDKFMQAQSDYQTMAQEFGVNQLTGQQHLYMSNVSAEPMILRSDDKKKKEILLGAMQDMDQHISMVAGREASPELTEDGMIEVVVSERGLEDMNLLLGDELKVERLVDENGNPYVLKVVGVFKNSDPEDLYWMRTPNSLNKECMMNFDLFNRLFVNMEAPEYGLNGQWYVVLDYEDMRGDQVERMLKVCQSYALEYEESTKYRYRDNFSGIFEEHLKKARQVDVTLWVLQAPVFVLLAAFIFMVSGQMLEMEQNEIAILKSRGAGRRQIILVYLMQSLLIGALSYALALPLSMAMCQVLGSANAFLEFVKRQALALELTNEVLLFGLAAALFSMATMVLPVFKHARVTIVSHKQRKSRRSTRPWWQKVFLDVVILGVSLYGLYNFNNQKDVLAQRVLDGATLDPLLFFSSSLFIIGAGLVMLRILPLITRLIFTVFKRLWSPALYASFLRVLRSQGSQGFIMVFLMLTIALGFFNAQTARTINTNEEEQIRYQAGADLRIQEEWSTLQSGGMGAVGGMAPSAGSGSGEVEYIEPDFGKYTQLDGVDKVTKVLVDDGCTVSVDGGSLKNVHLMGIHTKEFGEIAWMKDGLTNRHWYEYLNVMSKNSRAVLVSSNARDYGFEIGDVINYRPKQGDKSVRGVIYGFVDYFPTYAPVTYVKDTDGVYREMENFLIVAHLSQIQATCGVTPYEVWIKPTGSTSFIYDYIEEQNLSVAKLVDASAELVTLKNDPIFQGTNGILTVSFIVVLLLCATGFLIYWILSIQSRALQFGIFRAMGMSLREILSMLINEQLFISVSSIAVGAGIGMVAARLFIPLIQLAYAASDRVLPLELVSVAQDTQRLMAVIGGMMGICMIILGVLISRIKISQALKLGED